MEKESSEKEKKQWGGRRAGAGRKATVGNVATIGLRVPADVAAILDRQKNRTAFIIAAIREYDRKQQHPQYPLL